MSYRLLRLHVNDAPYLCHCDLQSSASYGIPFPPIYSCLLQFPGMSLSPHTMN